MIKQPTIIIFDQETTSFNAASIIQQSYSTIYCTSSSQLLTELQHHQDSIKIIIYCAYFNTNDYQLIQTIKTSYVVPEFILLSHDYGIDIFTDIAKLGIFSIHNSSIHHAIIELDINDIFSETLTYQQLLEKRLNHVLDIDLFFTYQNLLNQITHPIHHTSLPATLPPSSDQSANHPPHILIIEDNISLNLKLCNWLTKYGMSTTAAYTGETAYYLFKTQPFDLIILDLGLPDQNGSNLIQEFRKLNFNTPTILLTAYKDYDSLLSCMKEGAFEYITKPFNPSCLIKKIRYTLYFSQIRALNTPNR